MIVTTTHRPTPEMVARARHVATRCGASYTSRRRVLGFGEDQVAYVVGRNREELRGPESQLSVNLGLLHARRRAGSNHPLVATLAPTGARRIVDATLGLALDAVHLAAVLGCDVVGIEGSPAVFSLLEEGLPRLAREEPSASLVQPHYGDATTVLGAMPPRSADAVYLSPMFGAARRAPPGFDLLRAVALDAPLHHALLEAARRVARERVVVKVPPREALPVGSEVRRVHGNAVDYVVLAPA